MNKFEELGINKDLVDCLLTNNIEEPTPIQTLSIPEILKNKDVMAEAQTGTGKTLAFLLPMFQNFDENSEHTQGLIITPTRELAIQITTEARKLAKDTNFNILAVYGGQDINSQLRKLNRNVTLVIATPGRLLDHLKRKTVNIKNLNTLVLDEADQMLNIGFKEDIEKILTHTNKHQQMLCFSATLDSKVKQLAKKYLHNPVEVAVKKKNVTLDTIEQKIIRCIDREKQAALLKELDYTNPFMGIIFCRTKRRADLLEESMQSKGYDCHKLHGSVPQGKRQKIMKAFREARFQYLIATDVAARGLDISGVSHIYNYDVPENPETYIHRIGRTGRMNESGIAITFITHKDKEILDDIEKAIKMTIPKETYSEAKSADGKVPDHVMGYVETNFDKKKKKKTNFGSKEKKFYTKGNTSSNPRKKKNNNKKRNNPK